MHHDCYLLLVRSLSHSGSCCIMHRQACALLIILRSLFALRYALRLL